MPGPVSLSLHPRENEPLQLDFAACIINVDADKTPTGVVVEDDAFGDFSALDARVLREIDVEGVSLGIIGQLHGLNPRSRNALWMVTLSSSVTTRRYRPPSSGTIAQNRYRLFSCRSDRSGRSTTAMHHSRRK